MKKLRLKIMSTVCPFENAGDVMPSTDLRVLLGVKG